MEDHSGVDVSWLHHSNRGERLAKDHHHRQQAPSSPGLAKDAPPRTSAHGGLPPDYQNTSSPSSPACEKPPSPTPPSAATTPVKPIQKRPNILGRPSTERVPTLPLPDSKSPSRRGSWISSISSKFSSIQNTPPASPSIPAQPPTSNVNGSASHTSSPTPSANGAQNNSGGANEVCGDPQNGYMNPRAGTSFFSNALRRLSSGSQATPLSKVPSHGALCPRRIMNVDPNRDRCLVPDLEQSKLRRVAFCVDVEIAGGPRYKDEVNGDDKKKKKEKLRERCEGEALKNPKAMVEEKEKLGVVQVEREAVGSEGSPSPGAPMNDEDKKDAKKKEKKKRSEAERKERKEKKRRKAEENGTVPLELSRNSDDTSPNPTPVVSGTSTPIPKAQGRPTTDPLRIYRRCCQLRETPILKRVSDQLATPHNSAAALPGVVTFLDLTGSRLQLADIVTLGDWLAIVPVMKVILDDADLTDEMTRVVLAGLLSARVPGGLNRRSGTYTRGQNGESPRVAERTGVVEKLSLKNNPKITREGWKHISLFIYMCKSLKAIDVSMITFPQCVPATNGTSPPKDVRSADIADTLCKAISERLGGSRLEELIMAECSLSTQAIRRIIDAVTMSGTQRLGLAGNDIDDDGLDHVIRYVRSGVCQGLDLGGNELKNGIGRLCASIPPNCGLSLLSLADCQLDPNSLKPLFPALIALPNFRFLDLSHNRDLFSTSQPRASLCILRKYLPQLKILKRIHLMDVSMSPVEAIGLAEVLPECPQLAHLNILENPQISAITTASDEESQEDACALYASLMAAVSVSDTIICIDVDVPGPQTGEVVKALAKQVVAYCLRNMERLTVEPEFGFEQKAVEVPEVLLHLVGRGEHDEDDDPTPDDDYIVGGTGVVKALSYCLLQKASEIRRSSHTPSGNTTPQSRIGEVEGTGRALNMSKNLLESARNIRARLQPAIVRESRLDNDAGYRRLLFLDQTLQGMIRRFEDEYPECRLTPSEDIFSDAASAHSSTPSSTSAPTSMTAILATSPPEGQAAESDDEERKSAIRSRHNSDVSSASRALAIEEGRIHRLGQRVRAEILHNSRPNSSSGPTDPLTEIEAHSKPKDGLPLPTLDEIREKLSSLTGDDLRVAAERDNWEETLARIGQNAAEIQRLQHESPEEFENFRDAQMAALLNTGKDHSKSFGTDVTLTNDSHESAIED